MPFRFLGILVPDERQVLDMARFARLCEHPKRGRKHGALRLGIALIAQRPAEGMLDRRHSRHSNKAVEDPDHIERHRRDARGFDRA